MDDLISRTWLLAEYDKRHNGPPGGARKLIEEAPPALGTNLASLGTDCISRQAAIDALNTLFKKQVTQFGYEGYEKADEKTQLVCDGISYSIGCVLNLPTAQPEIIRCRNCKHMQEDKIFHQCWCNGNEVKYDHFCGYAERRTDGVDS